MSAIEIKNLNFIYSKKTPSEKHALRGINLTVEEGTFLGLVGATGSGKSTLIQHLNGLLKVQDKKNSSVVVNGMSATDKKTLKRLRFEVGMVFQYPEYQLFAETVKEDVAFGYKNFAPQKPTDEEIKSAVRAALEVVGLNYDEIQDKSPFDLSGGQKRRVAIAGVIVSRPEVLVLDEPAAGLDPAGKQEIMELLHKLHREWCRTVVVVSHDMDEIAENCNRVAVFSEGEVKYVLPPKELFEKSEELTSLGLDVPLTAKLTFALRRRGVNVKNDFTVEGLIQSVLDYAKGAPQEGESE